MFIYGDITLRQQCTESIVKFKYYLKKKKNDSAVMLKIDMHANTNRFRGGVFTSLFCDLRDFNPANFLSTSQHLRIIKIVNIM